MKILEVEDEKWVKEAEARYQKKDADTLCVDAFNQIEVCEIQIAYCLERR
jgi:hypothetical protein